MIYETTTAGTALLYIDEDNNIAKLYFSGYVLPTAIISLDTAFDGFSSEAMTALRAKLANYPYQCVMSYVYDSDTTTLLGYIGTYTDTLRAWTISLAQNITGTFWAVIDLNNISDRQTNVYETPPEPPEPPEPTPGTFDIKIGINRSERIALDKNFEVFATLTGTLKAETSIVDPVIIIEADVEALNRANYMEIEPFGRYYFITNIRSIRNGLVEISAHCDVLSSFKTAIRGNSGIIKRQENNWNLYLNDGTFKVYQNPMVLTKEFPTGFDSFSFIMGVAGTGRSVTPPGE